MKNTDIFWGYFSSALFLCIALPADAVDQSISIKAISNRSISENYSKNTLKSVEIDNIESFPASQTFSVNPKRQSSSAPSNTCSILPAENPDFTHSSRNAENFDRGVRRFGVVSQALTTGSFSPVGSVNSRLIDLSSNIDTCR